MRSMRYKKTDNQKNHIPHISLKVREKTPEEDKSKRLDKFITKSTNLSRSFIQKLVKKNYVEINGNKAKKASLILKSGDNVLVKLPPKNTNLDSSTSQESKKLISDLDIKAIYESEHFLILSKPPGISVQPGENSHGKITLTDWLIFNYKETKILDKESRSGIVHRLDKDTSGIMLVAKTNYGYKSFRKKFAEHIINKTYLAIVKGKPQKSGKIDFEIAKHPTNPIKMAHRFCGGKKALTHYFLKKEFKEYSLLELTPTSGRTHQIRVHCAAIGHPVIGDFMYGTKSSLIKRQALHAHKLEFEFNGKLYKFSKEPPEDFSNAIKAIKESAIPCTNRTY